MKENWIKKRLEEDEKDMPDHIDRTPRPYKKQKIKFTLASAVGLAGTMIKALAP